MQSSWLCQAYLIFFAKRKIFLLEREKTLCVKFYTQFWGKQFLSQSYALSSVNFLGVKLRFCKKLTNILFSFLPHPPTAAQNCVIWNLISFSFALHFQFYKCSYFSHLCNALSIFIVTFSFNLFLILSDLHQNPHKWRSNAICGNWQFMSGSRSRHIWNYITFPTQLTLWNYQ